MSNTNRKLNFFQSTNLQPLAAHYTRMRPYRYNPPSTEGSAARSENDSSLLDSIFGISIIDSPSAVDLSEVSLINLFDIILIICENYVN